MKTKYTVRSPLNHDNEFYREGESVDLDDKAAQPLLDAEVIALEKPSKSGGKGAGKSE